MKLFILSIFFLFTSFYANTVERKFKFTCTLQSDKLIYKIGEIPKLNVQIINKSHKEVYLVGALDGSDLKWRIPYCYFTIDKPIADTIIEFRCGNTDPLESKHFKLVKPNENFNPYQLDNQFRFYPDYTTSENKSFRNPGIYKIQFHYNTKTDNVEKFAGKFHKWNNEMDSIKIQHLFDSLPKIELNSNVIEISFEK